MGPVDSQGYYYINTDQVKRLGALDEGKIQFSAMDFAEINAHNGYTKQAILDLCDIIKKLQDRIKALEEK